MGLMNVRILVPVRPYTGNNTQRVVPRIKIALEGQYDEKKQTCHWSCTDAGGAIPEEMVNLDVVDNAASGGARTRRATRNAEPCLASSLRFNSAAVRAGEGSYSDPLYRAG